MSTPTPEPSSSSERAPSPYKSVSCPSSLDDLCTKLMNYGRELEKWGRDVLHELDDLKAASSGEGGPRGPPQDATQPPPSPFKKP